jgi:hypothetical protein
MSQALTYLRKAGPRLLRALLGVWLVTGPFVVFLIRWKSYELVIVFLAVIAAYVFVGWKSRIEGVPYLSQLASDTATALAATLVAGGLSGILAKFTGIYLHGNVLFVPLVILAGFWILEYGRERKRLAQEKAKVSENAIQEKAE